MSDKAKQPRWLEWLNSKSDNGRITAVKVQQAR